jgi:hypothetical protein
MNIQALISGVAALVGVAVYTFLAWRLLGRPVSPGAQLASYQFAAFWLGLALVTVLGAVESLIASAIVPPLALVSTLVYLEVLLLCVVLWCLVGYLLFLFTGRHFLGPLSVLYGALYVALLYLVTASRAVAVTVSAGAVSIRYATNFSTPLVLVLLVGLLLPELAGAVLYFTLVFRTRDRTVRYRITLVSWSLIGAFGLALVNLGALLGGGFAAQVFARSIPVIAAIVILLAYYPPAVIRTRFGIRSIESVAGPVDPSLPKPR